MQNIKSPKSWQRQTRKLRKEISKKYKPTSGSVSRYQPKVEFKKKLINKLINFILIIFILGCVSLLGLYAWVAKDIPDKDKISQQFEPSTTKIYDRTGEHLLYEIFTKQKRTPVSLADLSDYTKWATLVAEDRNFYSHSGFSFRGIVRSIFKNITTGSKVGGSSITQQLIKNAWLTSEKTYTRKIKELLMAFQIEQKYSKDEILEMYLNEIPYGSTAYGIEAASQLYFSKKSNELTLAESAVLAAIPNRPTYYSPYGPNKDKLIIRQRYILDSMAEEGYLTQDEANSAKEQPLNFNPPESSFVAPHFVLYIKELLVEKYGQKMVEQGGLKVITTLDYDKQVIAESAIKEGVEKNEANYNAHNAALLSMNPQTGEVLAMVGSRDYFNQEYDGAVNVVFNPRQPGSSFKPIVYAALFQRGGFSPDTILFDVLTTFKADPKDYEPHNYNDKIFGPVSIRKALAGSLNIPAVKAIYLAGVDNVLNLAESLGYTTFEDRSRFGLSLVLGGGEVKMSEHLKAFSTIANYGKSKTTKYILKVEDRDGKKLEENKPEKDKGLKVLDEQICKEIIDIMSDNTAREFVFGAKNYLILPDRPVAAKTGTTNDFHDGWTIGFTPQIATAVWVGNNNNAAMTGKADGSNVAAPIWNKYMREAHAGLEVEQFEKPESYTLPDKPMLNGQYFSETKVKIDKTSGLLATEFTPPSQIEEKSFKEIHNILHYVDKNFPDGPAPENPWDTDPNYTSWELAVEEWAKKENITTELPPTEYDTLHTINNQPTLEITEPVNNQIINGGLTTKIKASAPRGVSKVEYYIDNQLLTAKTSFPFDLSNYPVVGFQNGETTLKIVVSDDVDNRASNEIKIRLNLPEENTQPINLIRPTSGEEIWDEMFPYNLEINISNPTSWKKIDFYLKNKNSDNSIWLGYSDVNSSPTISYLWLTPPAEKGDYIFYALISNQTGRSIRSKEINIKIR